MLKNYIKIAYKVLLRRKFFTFISLFAISFTLMVLMVATAMLDHDFGQLPPETRQDRTLGIFSIRLQGEFATSTGPAGYGFLDRYARNLPNVEKESFFTTPNSVYSFRNGEKIHSYLKRTDGQFWEILEFNFLEGGPFTADDEARGNFVAVINEATRKKFFGDGQAIGETIEVDGQRFRVVGVVSNVPLSRQVPFADVWVPISTMKTTSYRSALRGEFLAILLAKSAADFPQIKEEYRSRLAGMDFSAEPNFNRATGDAETYFEFVSRTLSPDQSSNHPGSFLAVIIGLMLLFMLLPTVKLIKINVSRIMERASEIGVRKAFGASSWALVGQFVVENVLLTLIGGLIGFAGSFAVLEAISRSGLIPYAEFHVNLRIFLYGLALALFFGVFSGVYPAWKMSRLNPVQALKGGVR
jgi:putative ABC transport system permease protein